MMFDDEYARLRTPVEVEDEAAYKDAARVLAEVIAQHGSRPVPTGPTRVLEVGCGAGHLLAAGAQHALLMVGVERNRNARQRSDVLPAVQIGMSPRLPFLDDSFHACVSMDVLEHMGTAQVGQAVNEQLRVAPLVVSSVPVVCSTQTADDILAQDPTHVLALDPAAWIFLLRSVAPTELVSLHPDGVATFVTTRRS